MLQNCLYLVGMIPLPLAVEVLLAPALALALLWGALTFSFTNATQNTRTWNRMG